jgi:hypothetical protein
MNQHDRRATVIKSLHPRNRANAFFRLLMLAIRDDPPSGDDELHDLAIGAAGIICHALSLMSDTVERDELCAHLTNNIPKALARPRNQKERQP